MRRKKTSTWWDLNSQSINCMAFAEPQLLPKMLFQMKTVFIVSMLAKIFAINMSSVRKINVKDSKTRTHQRRLAQLWTTTKSIKI